MIFIIDVALGYHYSVALFVALFARNRYTNQQGVSTVTGGSSPLLHYSFHYLHMQVPLSLCLTVSRSITEFPEQNFIDLLNAKKGTAWFPKGATPQAEH